MYHLEELSLCFTVHEEKTFLDGNNLKKDILRHLSRLNRFSFSISSFIFASYQTTLPSPEDIQRTFDDFSNLQVHSCVDYFPKARLGRCLIYSCPSLLRYYDIITNHFPGGLFINVRKISLVDEHPFEHEFFHVIQKSFPFLQRLSVQNDHPQKCKPFSKSIDENENSSVIDYPYLNELFIVKVHDDYVEQFLVHSKTSFQNSILHINYESLQRITHNFTRDDTRINCTRINQLVLYGEKNHSDCLQEYFPSAKISYY
ncbi:unnamed protein product [Adineta ricciae]|uniref:Uncharacterized protein n=1 Tax=Adineta ricciae TaxID=249248 RepID=A0A816DK69_ADIRI|nr:unnamed protein product [Adineta ricciae]CAF1639636.1 unnamed protein product [Adineta ricciae]